MKDKAYYEDINIKNELKLREMIKQLPKFCLDFFIGIVQTNLPGQKLHMHMIF